MSAYDMGMVMEKGSLRIPMGVDDFKKVREGNYLFIDKTELISYIVDTGAEAYLFTRPRRFGKSLNLSMIDSFFNLKYKGNRWFDGLKVMDHPEAVSMMNSLPVIRIDMKDLPATDYDSFISKLYAKISKLYTQYNYLLDSTALDDVQMDIFMKGRRRELSENDLQSSLADLCWILNTHHGVKPIVLIDEYDSTINRSLTHDGHDRILGFLRGLYSETLKNNEDMSFGLVTGVMQIAKENLFSGLNHFKINNILTSRCSTSFGFTESEVRDILTHYGHPEKLDEVREWYDGYRFGDSEIYNPWSILNYIDEGYRAAPYWLNEGDPEIVLESMRLIGPDAPETITKLYNDGTIETKLNMNMVFSDLCSMTSLLSLLTGSGYLKAAPIGGGEWRLSLVNREVRDGLLDQLVHGRWDAVHMNTLSKAILSGSPDDLERELSRCLDIQMDNKVGKDERYYQAFTLGLLNCLTKGHYVRSEYGGGKGYSDIAIIPRNGRGPSAVLELKDEPRNTDDGTMVEVSKAALRQIFDLRYFADLHGELHLYGIATRQSDVFVTHERVVR